MIRPDDIVINNKYGLAKLLYKKIEVKITTKNNLKNVPTTGQNKVLNAWQTK